MPIYSRIAGTGGVLPPRLVSNNDLVHMLGTMGIESSNDWIRSRTGIMQRYWVDQEGTTSQLAVQAGQMALRSAELGPDTVDLVLVATSTPDCIFPSTACLVQNALSIRQGAAFDIQAVCAGFVYAMVVADSMIRSGAIRCALVIGADTFSNILDFSDRTTCVLFGDGAGAVVLVASDSPGVKSATLHADGRYESILHTPSRVSKGAILGNPFLMMDGQEVFKQAVEKLESVSRETVDKAGMSLDSVDWLVLHQANERILQSVGRRLGLEEQKVVMTVSHHANTSSASIPLALNCAIEDGRISPADQVLLAAVGGGLVWGSVLLEI